ncbi:hypothetical protein MICAK_3540007 [Microcystis aeruginosa PCC 9701]|uniref:Uncharacterized protein n=1 Tax=Microcystis aeruginosa PCC 9701 TaxID=721123 RepID=I4IU57_MICAE|nr:hypothetical protein MICAK_3540007 [Microcystis aeruginosa PCC 9701]
MGREIERNGSHDRIMQDIRNKLSSNQILETEKEAHKSLFFTFKITEKTRKNS